MDKFDFSSSLSCRPNLWLRAEDLTGDNNSPVEHWLGYQGTQGASYTKELRFNQSEMNYLLVPPTLVIDKKTGRKGVQFSANQFTLLVIDGDDLVAGCHGFNVVAVFKPTTNQWHDASYLLLTHLWDYEGRLFLYMDPDLHVTFQTRPRKGSEVWAPSEKGSVAQDQINITLGSIDYDIGQIAFYHKLPEALKIEKVASEKHQPGWGEAADTRPGQYMAIGGTGQLLQNQWDGVLYELITFPHKITDGDRDLIFETLSNKYRAAK